MQLRKISIVVLTLVAAACNRGASQTYGFIATLGNDTTSVERITRTRDHIVGDAVGRSPLVVRRHWEATLAPDGSMTHWTMDTSVPNAPPETQAELHHTVDFTSNAVRISRRLKSGTTNVAYQKKYAVTVPWNAFVYGTWEVLFDVARNHPDSTHIGQYFFEGWDEGHVGYAIVKKLGNNAFSISSTGLAGSGVGHLDDEGRMLSYDGTGTTYKQQVKRIDPALDIDAIATRFAADEKAKGVTRALSVRDTARGTIGATEFTIDYSRPLARGRTLVGGLIPYDQVWRTGANAATQLTLSRPAKVAGIDLKAGTYTLWTIPSQKDVKLIINGQYGQWGTEYNDDSDIARVVMDVTTTPSPVEKFTIRFEPDGSAGRLLMEWGTFRWSVPVTAK